MSHDKIGHLRDLFLVSLANIHQLHNNTKNNNRLTALFPGLPRWASIKRNTHLLTPILIISHPLSTIHSILCLICVPGSRFRQPLSRSSSVCLVVWGPLLCISHISSPNHYLLFATCACFAVVSRLCHLFIISLSAHYLEICLLPYTSTWPFWSLLAEVPAHSGS